MPRLRFLSPHPLLTHEHTDVRAVLEYMASRRNYMTSRLEANDTGKYMDACLVVVRLAAALPEDQFTPVREQLCEMFKALPALKTFARCVGLATLLDFLQSVINLAGRDMGLIGSGAVAVLKDAFALVLQPSYREKYCMRQDVTQMTADLETLYQDTLK